MNYRNALLVALLSAAGFLAGTKVPSHGYQEGRVSACKDVLGGLSQVLPNLATIECTQFKGEAAIKAGDNYYSLDGSKKLN